MIIAPPSIFGRSLHAMASVPFKVEAGINPFLSSRTTELLYTLQNNYQSRINELIRGTEMSNLNLYDTIEKTHRDSSAALLHHLASQAWNLDFFMQGLTINYREPLPALRKALEADFGGLEEMCAKFNESADAIIASGWTWLVRSKEDGHFAIINTYNGGSPMFLNNRNQMRTNDQDTSAVNSTVDFSKLLGLTFAGKNAETNNPSTITTATANTVTVGNTGSGLKNKEGSFTPVIALNMWEHAYLFDYGVNKKQYIENFWRCLNWNRIAVLLDLF